MHPSLTKPLILAGLLCLGSGALPVAGETLTLCAVTFALPSRPIQAALQPRAELADTAGENLPKVAPAPLDDAELLPPEAFVDLVKYLCAAGQSADPAELAKIAPEARRAIASLRRNPAFAEYAAWLQNQLDDAEAADTEARQSPLFTPPRPPVRAGDGVPHYDFWLGRVAEHPRPERADEFLPRLREAFAAEGVPAALVWLAETESSFNPRARSPSGARGLFQLMPDTARSLGLDLRPDERVHPVRSARAAAAYLRRLHERFGSWPLALAAYNAGESRVARELKRSGAGDFAAIAANLPAETRFYVPKVLATVQLRAGVSPEDLGAPVLR